MRFHKKEMELFFREKTGITDELFWEPIRTKNSLGEYTLRVEIRDPSSKTNQHFQITTSDSTEMKVIGISDYYKGNCLYKDTQYEIELEEKIREKAAKFIFIFSDDPIKRNFITSAFLEKKTYDSKGYASFIQPDNESYSLSSVALRNLKHIISFLAVKKELHINCWHLYSLIAEIKNNTSNLQKDELFDLFIRLGFKYCTEAAKDLNENPSPIVNYRWDETISQIYENKKNLKNKLKSL